MHSIVGQSRAVNFIRRSLADDKLAHAYLFCGPPHVGKRTVAVKLAQSVNCPATEPPCGSCSSCVRIADGKHPDVRLIRRVNGDSGEAETRKAIGIDQIRELQQSASLEPYEGRYRVFIIDGAEHLNEESSNCLLKTLEEPPSRVLIILLAENESSILPTVASRCQKIEFFPVPTADIEQALVRQGVEPERAAFLGKLSRGRIGWAIAAGSNEKILEEYSSRLSAIQGLAEAGLEQRFDFAASLAQQFGKNREKVEETLEIWVDWWRDLLYKKIGCENLIVNVNQEEKLRTQSRHYSLGEMRGAVSQIQEALAHLERNANPRLALEVLMLSVPSAKDGQLTVS